MKGNQNKRSILIVAGEGTEYSTRIEKGAAASSDAAAPWLIAHPSACVPDRVCC